VTALNDSQPILVVEAATAQGSVALLTAAHAPRVRRVSMGVGREDQLFPAIQELLTEAELSPGALGAVVCGAGPGSFTSLRIAASLAKGLAHGAGCALYAVPSLLLAAAALPSDLPTGRYLLHADALRGERYVQAVLIHTGGRVEADGSLSRISTESFAAGTSAADRVVVGPEVPALPSRAAVWPDAARCLQVAGAWREAPVSLNDWEPEYGRLAEAQVKWEAAHGVSLPG
jgi:tRNA threonylcarbamoyladenosine biosynthesis protein TsaB